MAYKHCLNGCTDKELAEVFEVSESTLNLWKQKHPRFSESIKKGKRIANAEVAAALFKRATGAFTLPAVKIFQHEGESYEHEYTERFPPDTAAAIFFLKNRDPEHWRDKQHFEHAGRIGGAASPEEMSIEQIDAELAKRKAMQEQQQQAAA